MTERRRRPRRFEVKSRICVCMTQAMFDAVDLKARTEHVDLAEAVRRLIACALETHNVDTPRRPAHNPLTHILNS